MSESIPDENDLSIGQRLKAARRALSITQKDIGEAIGSNRHAIQNYETGRVRLPWSVAYSIFKYFPRISISWVGEGRKPIIVEDNQLEMLEINSGREPFLPGRPFKEAYIAQWKKDLNFSGLLSSSLAEASLDSIASNFKGSDSTSLSKMQRWELKLMLTQLIKLELEDLSKSELISQIEAHPNFKDVKF